MDFSELLKQAGEMQKKVKTLTADLEKQSVTGESGGGMVRVTLNGKQEVMNVSIDSELLGMQNRAALEIRGIQTLHEASSVCQPIRLRIS